MKPAVRVEAVLVECGDCDEVILAPRGSEFWTVAELDLVNRRVVCSSCGAIGTVRVPGKRS